MNELEVIRQKRKQEHRYGDVRKACEAAGVTPPIFQKALRKQSLDELTKKELEVMKAYVKIIDERKNDIEEFKNNIINL